ncbi:hypothetical protein D9M68_321040 [compost metagenome]
MARPRTPTRLLLLRGSFKHHAGRYREEPEGQGALGRPPRYLSPGAQQCWLTLAKQAPPGLLSGSDRAILTLAATLYHQWAEDPPAFPVGRLKRLMSLLSRMGFDPWSRQRLIGR